MSPKNKIKLNLLRRKLDKLDYQLLKTIKKRTEIIKKVLSLTIFNRRISRLSNFFLKKFSFILFLGDIYLIGFTNN